MAEGYFRSSDEVTAACQAAANRLHHLSMRYVGALAELGSGAPVGLLTREAPGLREGRDLIDAILLTRAELNGLTKCLLDSGVLKADQVTRAFAEEYDWLAQAKAQFLGCEVDDAGLVFKPEQRNP